jgi:hypothetical protein
MYVFHKLFVVAKRQSGYPSRHCILEKTFIFSPTALTFEELSVPIMRQLKHHEK